MYRFNTFEILLFIGSCFLLSTAVLSDDSKALSAPESLFRAFDYRTLCKNIQEFEKMFTGKCHLNLSAISENLDKLRTFIKNQSIETSFEKMLNDGFKNSTFFFQNTYFPNFTTEFQKFSNGINSVFTKIKTSTKNINLEEIYSTVFPSDVRAVITELIGPNSQSCPVDSIFCPNTINMTKITEIQSLSIGLNTFLEKITLNTVDLMEKWFYNEDFKSEVESIVKLLDSLETNGIAGTTVKELINVVSKENGFFDFFKRIYESGFQYTTRRATTTKAAPTTTSKSDTQATKLSVPFSEVITYTIPSVMFALGIVSSFVIVFIFYRFKAVANAPVGSIQHRDIRI